MYQMQDGGPTEHSPVSKSSLLSELKTCTSSRNLTTGRRIHEAAIRSGIDSNVSVASALINMYGKCGSWREASKVFEEMKDHNVVAWTALILGYADNGEPEMALGLFARMQLEGCVPDARTYVAALKACAALAMGVRESEAITQRGKALHLLASCGGCDSNRFVANILVNMYGKCGCIEEACIIFNRMQTPDVVTWTALILGYVENGESELALDLFSRMQRQGLESDSRIFVAALKACTDLVLKQGKEAQARCKEKGKAVHLLVSASGYASNLFVESVLVDMYSKCGSMDDARRVFDSVLQPDEVVWNSLISGYADNGDGDTALDLFSRISCFPDARSIVSALKALEVKEARIGKANLVERGRALHFLASSCGCDSDVYVQTTLLGMYARCGSIEDAQMVFDRMQYRDVKSWTALISAYVESGKSAPALDLFSRMEREGSAPDERTLVAVLKACTDLALKEQGLVKVRSRDRGKALQLLGLMSGFHSNIFVECTMLDLFAKCGSMKDAQDVFSRIKHPDVISWNALLLGYAENGEADLVLELFASLKRDNLEPDVATFLAVLKACAMLGALEFGKALHAEIHSRGLDNNAALATCLMDFYAKCGSLVEAEHFFELHTSKDLVTWNALMAGYGRLGDTQGVFNLFERLRVSSLTPDGFTFNIIFTACSHAGLVDKGTYYFELMTRKYAVKAEVEHYSCLIDMLGRANKLDDAMSLLRGMPFSPDAVMWTSVLAACRKWTNVELGKLAFESSVSLDNKNSGAYLLRT